VTRRAYYWPILIVGVVLIIAPFAISLPSKGSAGQDMLNNFHPIMQPASVKETVSLYNNTFLALKPVAQGGVVAAGEIPSLVTGLGAALHLTPAQVEQFLGSKYPAFAQLLSSFPQLVPVFTRVPGGLLHYAPLVATMKANVTNYAKVDSLPNFNLFTWFFVVPGALIVILALLGLGLFPSREERKPAASTEGAHDENPSTPQ